MATLEGIDASARDELALLMLDLSNTPKTRKQVLQLTKEVRPDTPVPELDLEERIAAATKESNDKVAALEAKLGERDMRAELNRRRQALGRSEDEVAAIEKIMLDKKISDHETAAEYYDWMRQAAPPTPATYDRQFLDKGSRDVLKDYWKNPTQAARDIAAKSFEDFRRGRKSA